ncbi:MAG: M48 family metallopeptidase [Verrucomicrobia bacterium]|nr:M48 family metallopeptidase [Verrucomicrobiota bacterium]MCH8528957.1 M48 family metallopeptidase [Kiritimatiellia bacterium]
MPKTFFDHQQEARIRSRWAVFGFILTVFLTVLSVALISAGLMGALGEYSSDGQELVTRYQWDVIFGAAGFTLVIVLMASLFRHVQMQAGPDHVMNAMDGKRVNPESGNPRERQLLNIVEEMAIASGLPVPDVYIVDEPGINAFAVGLSTDRAAVGVTRGALETFTRDEMQGVIAHEFSHILNGDMRLNTRLIAMLAGLFILSELGMVLFRIALHSGGGRRRSRSGKDNGGGTLVFLGFGLAVWVCGSIGLLMGRILQASMSRQREFLADASAVQFTRNPDGIANALRKLGKGSRKAKLQHEESLELAHMMFGSAKPMSLSGLMATHPPLDQRIKQIQPGWDGSFLAATPASPPPIPKNNADKTSKRIIPPPIPRQAARAIALGAMQSGMGAPGPAPEAVEAAHTLHETLPDSALQAARTPDGARALVYRLLLQSDQPDVNGEQEKAVQRHESPEMLQTLLRLHTATADLPEADRLPLLDIAVPALRHLDADTKAVFKTTLEALIRADGKVSLYEYAVRRVALRAVESEAEAKARLKKRIHIREAGNEVNLLLSVLAHVGAESEEEAEASFDAARQTLLGHHGGITLTLQPREGRTLAALNEACEKLAALYPAFQQRVMNAALAAVANNGQINTDEFNAFRAAAAALNVPVPPDFRSA